MATEELIINGCKIDRTNQLLQRLIEQNDAQTELLFEIKMAIKRNNELSYELQKVIRDYGKKSKK